MAFHFSFSKYGRYDEEYVRDFNLSRARRFPAGGLLDLVGLLSLDRKSLDRRLRLSISDSTSRYPGERKPTNAQEYCAQARTTINLTNCNFTCIRRIVLMFKLFCLLFPLQHGKRVPTNAAFTVQNKVQLICETVPRSVCCTHEVCCKINFKMIEYFSYGLILPSRLTVAR